MKNLDLRRCFEPSQIERWSAIWLNFTSFVYWRITVLSFETFANEYAKQTRSRTGKESFAWYINSKCFRYVAKKRRKSNTTEQYSDDSLVSCLRLWKPLFFYQWLWKYPHSVTIILNRSPYYCVVSIERVRVLPFTPIHSLCYSFTFVH